MKLLVNVRGKRNEMTESSNALTPIWGALYFRQNLSERLWSTVTLVLQRLLQLEMCGQAKRSHDHIM